MPKLFSIGGYVAAAALILFGVALIAIGVFGRGYVRDELAQEKIVGSPDMTPAQTTAAVKESGVSGITVPTCSVAGEEVDTGQEAKCFASYMRVHTLEATGGKTYAEMPRFATEDGAGTNEESEAVKGPDGAPAPNQARNIWVNETALTTALNTSFFAEAVGGFAAVVGIALLLIGVGFLVLTAVARRRATGADSHTQAPPAPASATPA